MRPFERQPEPAIISEWLQYGKRYAQNREANVGFRFQWPTINGQRLNQILMPLIRFQSQSHCAYCDRFPLGTEESIDHFKPKNKPEFYHDICKWENLYYACKWCQDVKGSDYSDLIIRPDSPQYTFMDYFTYNYSTHEIQIKSGISELNNERAAQTLAYLGLNTPSHLISRRHAFERFMGSNHPNLDDLNYRYIFE